MDANERSKELDSLIGKFDESVNSGKLPTIEEFRRICKYRAERIRHTISVFGDWGKASLTIEAERLEKAAAGDKDELVAESLAHVKSCKWFIETEAAMSRLLKKSEHKITSDWTSGEKTWKLLAELVKKS